MLTIPQHIDRKLGKALIHADKDTVIRLIEEHSISPNALTDESSLETVLLNAIIPLNDYQGTVEHIELIAYLLKAGGDVNAKRFTDIKKLKGFNSLHLSLPFHSLCEISLLLITKGSVNVHDSDGYGNTPLFMAIREYGLTWRPEQEKEHNLQYPESVS